MTSTRPAATKFREGDPVVLAHGSYQGTPGVFLRLRCDVNWADITERNGKSALTRWYGWLTRRARPEVPGNDPCHGRHDQSGEHLGRWMAPSYLPSLLVQSQPDSNGWAAVEYDRPTFEKAVQNAGWTLFFMAGEIEATVLGFDREKALRAAFRRLIANVTSQHCNSIEITRVTGRSLSGRSLRECFRPSAASTEGCLFPGNGADSDRVRFPRWLNPIGE